VTRPVLKIKRLQGKNGCDNCRGVEFTHDKVVRYYLASLTGVADNINDENVAAGLQIFLQSLDAGPKKIDQFKNDDQEKPQKTILDEPMEIEQSQNEQFDMTQENTVEEQKEPQEEEIFEDVEQSEYGFMGFQEE
jgi:hypothetical protein